MSRRGFLAAAGALALAGCGFELRKAPEFAFKSIAVSVGLDQNLPQRGDGHVEVSFAAAPENIQTMTDRVLNAVKKLQQEGPSADLTSRAKETARRGYETPAGSYYVQRMERMWHSRKYHGAPMPHALFFAGGIAIHATSAVGQLGRPASHGCVRLSPKNARALFELVGQHGW